MNHHPRSCTAVTRTLTVIRACRFRFDFVGSFLVVLVVLAHGERQFKVIGNLSTIHKGEVNNNRLSTNILNSSSDKVRSKDSQ